MRKAVSIPEDDPLVAPPAKGTLAVAWKKRLEGKPVKREGLLGRGRVKKLRWLLAQNADDEVWAESRAQKKASKGRAATWSTISTTRSRGVVTGREGRGLRGASLPWAVACWYVLVCWVTRQLWCRWIGTPDDAAERRVSRARHALTPPTHRRTCTGRPVSPRRRAESRMVQVRAGDSGRDSPRRGRAGDFLLPARVRLVITGTGGWMCNGQRGRRPAIQEEISPPRP